MYSSNSAIYSMDMTLVIYIHARLGRGPLTRWRSLSYLPTSWQHRLA